MATIALANMDFENLDFERDMAAAAGHEVVIIPERDAASIARGIAEAGAEAVVTSYGVFDRALYEANPQLKVVSRTGIGYDTIEVPSATENGIYICVVPGYGTEVVSDHTITLALSVLRRINEVDADMRNGIWDYAAHRPLGQVYGRTFGVVGMGEIGRAVARKAHGLGFKVVCWSRSLKPGRHTPEGYDILPLDSLLSNADVVSFHTALTPETHHLLNAERLATMKPTAVVINTSRGAVVDTVALAHALEAGKLWGAGLDVFEVEPVDPNHPIMKAPHTVLSSHAAYWSEESGAELRTRAMQAVIDALDGKVPVDALNPEAR